MSSSPTRQQNSLDSKRRRIETLLQGWTGDKQAAEILGIMRGCEDQELGRLMAGLSASRLLTKIHDHPGGTPHYQNLLQLLCVERVQTLSTETRAQLIFALQAGPTRAEEEQAIAQLLCATRGEELQLLKEKIDHQPDYHDLHQLVFDDVDDVRVRSQILDHFQSEASGNYVKLLSDIDDTFYANWKDQRFPKGTVYPGVRQFYEELDHPRPGRPEDLTFVTARPDDHLGRIKTATKKTLREKGLKDMVVLAGTIPALVSDEAIAAEKFDKMRELHQLYPDSGILFVGDSGQGDALCGSKLNRTNWKDYHGTLIHDVVGLSSQQKEELTRQRIFVFDSYVGAALQAQALALISLESVVRVAQAAVNDFGRTGFASAQQQAERQKELQADLNRVNQQLPAQEAIQFPT